ncbi:hypothetical protein [Streptomyces sp. S1]|uniref:hypothetical protein n=1 Tax=Streptomyces sp. S1 TaxID=718288 RepID=UPI003D751BFB
MDVLFSDPDAWGYCPYCAFVVAVDLESRQMLGHDRMGDCFITRRCYGSLMEPGVQPAPEAEPIPYEDVIANAIRSDD